MIICCVQIGYWSERRGYVNTAIYKPVQEEFHGLQNRTYVVTTILVRTRHVITSTRVGESNACDPYMIQVCVVVNGLYS